MRQFLAVTLLWIALAVIGAAGLVSGQTALMTVCFLAWTPAAIMFGWSLKAGGLRVVVHTADNDSERKPAASAQVQSINAPPVQRKRRVQSP